LIGTAEDGVKTMALGFLKSVLGSRNGSGRDLLLPTDQFQTLILHECARCDRNAHVFSLIHIDLRNGAQDRNQHRGQAARSLTRTLLRRMRTTDEIGWLDENTIGVFLPETETDGARSLARDACQGFSYQIYTYPWLTDIHDYLDAGESLSANTKEDRLSSGVSESEEEPPATHRQYSGEESSGVERGCSSVMPIVELVMPPGAPFWKRTYDLLGSAVMLAALSPLFAAVTLYIKLVSRGPVFFRQERIGYLGKPFTMLKFRTMKVGSDNISVHKTYLKELIKTEDKVMTKLDTGKDDRLIPMGKLLRRTCLDELPQLINVFKGDMSLVGPRPCLDYEAQDFSLWQRKRFNTIPGMTGLWQVSGKNRLTFKEMMRLDVRYANRKNMAMDLIISFKTVPAILGQVRDAVQGRYSAKTPHTRVKKTLTKAPLHQFIRQLFL